MENKPVYMVVCSGAKCPLDNKKDISLNVLFRTFQVNFQDISVTLP
jgi:hypothetical protein